MKWNEGGVPRETAAQLAKFASLIEEWNSRINLLSDDEISSVETRHIPESVAAARLVGSGSIADLGSGAGFPGLVVALILNRPVLLVEADRRKAAFLREAVRITEARATVFASRFERLEVTFDNVLARAVAPLARLLPLVHPRLAPAGRCVFLKGGRWRQEIQDAQHSWHFNVASYPTTNEIDGRFLVVSRVKPLRVE